jgi:DNA-binding NarL/FixJ family response regulator
MSARRRRHIFTKLGVHSRAQAVALAYHQNLIGERVPDEVAG